MDRVRKWEKRLWYEVNTSVQLNHIISNKAKRNELNIVGRVALANKQASEWVKKNEDFQQSIIIVQCISMYNWQNTTAQWRVCVCFEWYGSLQVAKYTLLCRANTHRPMCVFSSNRKNLFDSFAILLNLFLFHSNLYTIVNLFVVIVFILFFLSPPWFHFELYKLT